MILSMHSTAGAILASNCNNIWQAILLGITSHYFLDSIPHIEYKVENIKNGNPKIAGKEFAKVFFDLLMGLIIILYFVQNKNSNQLILILTGSFFALLPDGLYLLDCLIKDKDKNIFTPAPNQITNKKMGEVYNILVRGFTKFLKMHSVFHFKTHSTISKKIITIPSQIVIILILIYYVLK